MRMIEKFQVKMKAFNEDRMIRVLLPENYHQGLKKYPVLYMHDGQNAFNDNEAIGGHSLKLEDYIKKNKIELIIVAIDQNSQERMNEYCPWKNGEYSKKLLGKTDPTGGKGKEYVDFIVDELKPFIDEKYRTNLDRTFMAGISLGGLISTYAACAYPHIFRNIAVISSAFFRNQEEIEKLLKSSDLNQLEQFYLDAGTSESKNDQSVSAGFLKSNQAIYEILKEKNVNVTFNIIEGGQHHYLEFRKRVPDIFSYFCQ